jgi:hypothetical protein
MGLGIGLSTVANLSLLMLRRINVGAFRERAGQPNIVERTAVVGEAQG